MRHICLTVLIYDKVSFKKPSKSGRLELLKITLLPYVSLYKNSFGRFARLLTMVLKCLLMWFYWFGCSSDTIKTLSFKSCDQPWKHFRPLWQRFTESAIFTTARHIRQTNLPVKFQETEISDSRHSSLLSFKPFNFYAFMSVTVGPGWVGPLRMNQ